MSAPLWSAAFVVGSCSAVEGVVARCAVRRRPEPAHDALQPEARLLRGAAHRRVLGVGPELHAMRALLIEQMPGDQRHGLGAEPPSARAGEQPAPQLEEPGRRGERAVTRLHVADQFTVRLDAEVQDVLVPPRSRGLHAGLDALTRDSVVGPGDLEVAAIRRFLLPERRRFLLTEGPEQDGLPFDTDAHGRAPPTHGGRNTLRSGTI